MRSGASKKIVIPKLELGNERTEAFTCFIVFLLNQEISQGDMMQKFFVSILNVYHRIKLENLREYHIFQSIL
jgi:hypothetical protein